MTDATRTPNDAVLPGERWGIVDVLFRHPGSHAVCRAVDAAGEEAIVRLYTRFLDESNWALFQRAVARRARIEHPNVLPVIGADWTQQRPSVIFEPLAAHLLTELIEERALEPVDVLRVLADVADATRAIERRSVPAAEITPGDIFVTHTGRGILMGDVGVPSELHTHRGPYDELYLAPERFGWQLHPEQHRHVGRFTRLSRRLAGQGDRHYDSPTPASTVFSFGCVLFEALTGSAPFDAEERRPLLGAHSFLDPPSASALRADLPQDIDYVIARALANAPEERYRNPSEMLEAAADALGVRPAELDRAWAPSRGIGGNGTGPADLDTTETLDREASSVEPDLAAQPPIPVDPAPQPPSITERESPPEPDPTVPDVPVRAFETERVANAEPQPEERVAAHEPPGPRDEIDLLSPGREPIDLGPETPRPHTSSAAATAEPELIAPPVAAATVERETAKERRRRTSTGRLRNRAPWLIALAAVVASIAAGAALGRAGGDSEPDGPGRLALGATTLPLPTGWDRGDPASLPFKSPASALVARPDDTPGAGLVIARGTTGLSSNADAVNAERSAVRVGRLVAWRYAGIEAGRGTVADLYVAPTNAGMYEIACFARAADAAGFLPTCGRVATGLRIRGAEPLPLTGDDATRQQLSGTLKTLGEQRVTHRLRLSEASRPAGQAAAAGALSRAFNRAAESVAALPAVGAPGDQDQIVAALQAVGAEYASLSEAAANGDGTEFAAERRAVVAREQELRKAIDLLARAN